jgi:uncharacterized protein involved in exopolysaccharide biosynthesis
VDQEKLYELNKEESIDFKALFFKFYRYWYLFVLTIIVAVIIAFLFNKYTEPVYEISTTVLVKDDASMDPQSLIGLGSFGRRQQNIENEIGILQSHSLAYRTVTRLPFEVSYYYEKDFIKKEIYGESPFIVEFDTNHVQPTGLQFQLNFISNSKFKLTAEGQEISLYDYHKAEDAEAPPIPGIKLEEEYFFGEMIETPDYKFRVVLNSKFDPEVDNERDFIFMIIV